MALVRPRPLTAESPTTPARVHLLYNAWVNDKALLAHLGPWEIWLRTAAQQAGATILAEQFHQFDPHGITGFLLLAESHISVHTWPEEGLAAIDVFTCGRMDANAVIAYLRQRLQPREERLTAVER